MVQFSKSFVALWAFLGLVACSSVVLEETTVNAVDDGSSVSKGDKNSADTSKTSKDDVSAGVFTDSRDGLVYKTVEIGSRTWMAENLKFVVEDGKKSWCRREKVAHCQKVEREALADSLANSVVKPGSRLKPLPVTVFDWLHGDKGDGDGAGRNGDPANGVSADFGSGGCGGGNNGIGFMAGMVQRELGPNGVPVPADPFPSECKITTHLDSWFLPEVVATGADGREYTNMTCRTIYATPDDDGGWLAEISSDKISLGNEANKGGMFILDDFVYLDSAKTVKNPYYDAITSNGEMKHNYGFTMKMEAQFVYEPGQYFDFYGDDDVWIFIDNKLAVDIGGQHHQIAGAVDLDTLGLTVGNVYTLHIFYAERHINSSNFRMKTSIDFEVPSRMFVTKDVRDSNVLNASIWEIERGSMYCDRSATEDTVFGKSKFTLFGPGEYSDGVPLDSLGVAYYGGITINSDFAGISIDQIALGTANILPVGDYFVRAELLSDPDEYSDLSFAVDRFECSYEIGECEGGRYYTWSTAVDTSKNGACPKGWRLPNADEWNSLWAVAGGKTAAGKMLKSRDGWNDNGNGSDGLNFNGLPEGYRSQDGNIDGLGSYAVFWSASEFGSSGAYGWGLRSEKEDVAYFGAGKEDYGLSVRCVKDE